MGGPVELAVRRTKGLVERLTGRYASGRTALEVAGGYAAVVAGVTVFVLVANAVDAGSLSGVWIILVTMPVSLLLLYLPVYGPEFTLLFTAGGLVQAWVLWRVLRGGRRPAEQDGAPEAGDAREPDGVTEPGSDPGPGGRPESGGVTEPGGLPGQGDAPSRDGD